MWQSSTFFLGDFTCYTFFSEFPICVMKIMDNGLANGLLFHMTQPTNRTTTRNHCTEQTNHNSEH